MLLYSFCKFQETRFIFDNLTTTYTPNCESVWFTEPRSCSQHDESPSHSSVMAKSLFCSESWCGICSLALIAQSLHTASHGGDRIPCMHNYDHHHHHHHQHPAPEAVIISSQPCEHMGPVTTQQHAHYLGIPPLVCYLNR